MNVKSRRTKKVNVENQAIKKRRTGQENRGGRKRTEILYMAKIGSKR